MDLIFNEHPAIELGGNEFICSAVIQYEDTPLMEVGQFNAAGFTTRFSIYYNDGTKIAVVKGSRIFLTEEGEKAKLFLRHEPNLTACEAEGRTIYELRRKGASALKGAAELYAPEGVFIKVDDAGLKSMIGTGGQLTAGGITMSNMRVTAPIGILFEKNGGVAMGAARGDQKGPCILESMSKSGLVVFGGGGRATPIA